MLLMKALSLKQPWANLVAFGKKTIETRRWTTMHRGDLLIVSCKEPPIEPAGCALAVVKLVDCRPMTWEDMDAACCALYPRAQAWIFTNIRRIEPFPVRGEMGLYDVPVSLKKLRLSSPSP